jgi:hypothetical protein
MWLVTRYTDVVSVLRDARFIRRGPTYQFGNPNDYRVLPGDVRKRIAFANEFFPRQMLFENPPNHTRLRALVSGAFTPAVVEGMRPRVQAITDSLLDASQARGRMDVIKEFATPLPIAVIAELLGLPATDYEKVKQWSDDIAASLDARPSLSASRQAGKSLREFRRYFDSVLASLRGDRGNTLLAAMVAAEAAGEKLSPEELFANSVLLLAAGHETTTNLIGNGLLALLKNPEQWAYLREHPESLPSAVEELLRFDSPVQWTARVAGSDFELQGRQILKDDLILIGLAAANHDPTQFAQPHKLDVTRKDNRHLAFGQGIHFCLGAALARLEAEVAFSTLLRRFPNLRLEPSKIVWRGSIFLRGMTSLPVALL